MEKLRSDHNATAALFIGDDVTDEHVLNHWIRHRLLRQSGLGRLPPGSGVENPQRVLGTAVLGEEREAWLAGANAVPYQDHALLADGTDLALVTPDGSINWLCHPNPDAPAVLGIIPGIPGRASEHPGQSAVGVPLSQNYLDKP